jgi:hypothetical protein
MMVDGGSPCRTCTRRLIEAADARGDGAMVNALCWYARTRGWRGLMW